MVASAAAPEAPGIVHWASGGTDGGGSMVGAAEALAVGVGVGVGEGLAVGFAVGDADGEADADGLAVAVGAALGLGDGSTVDGRARATTSRPSRSCSWSVCPRDSTRATPCIAARQAVSWAMTSSGQAIRVVASGPITTARSV